MQLISSEVSEVKHCLRKEKEEPLFRYESENFIDPGILSEHELTFNILILIDMS